ncbi:Fungalysin metallopeptidase-domain-containing protein [Flagelloscypha sp. PMI_526]|nr:Fungalysin metallopeptidase-domain-containing protein [Flagelloscypha sp. PMI_526]
MKFFTAVYLAIAFASTSFAAPWPSSSKLSSRRSHVLGRGLQLEAYHPESTLETYGEGVAHPLMKRAAEDLKDAATSFVAEKLGISQDDVQFNKGAEADVSKVAFVKQTANGIPFANAVANVAFSHDDKVTSFGSSFVTPKNIASSTPSVALKDAISTAEKQLEGTYNQWPATVEYVVKADGSAALAHVVQIQNDATDLWVEAFVDAHSGEVLQVTDFVAQASYRVLPITKEVLTEGFETLTDPQDTTSSPFGWHSTGTTNTTTTAGNNVITYISTTSGTSSQSSTGLNFVYTQDPSSAPTTSANKDAARVNAFYIVNTIHDYAYRYGFTESTFNFQTNNNGKGGSANDRVLVSVQDTGGTDNANFATPADGQSGQMRMYLWDLTSPKRDGALENDIVIHEMTHGITNRMTGGGTGRCLQTTEAGGMGEGWSDAMADWNHQNGTTTADFVLGQYVINDAAGIRSHPYSTSKTTNPYTYATVKTQNEVHDIGEIWANILHNVYAALVTAHGFSSTAKTNPTGTEGNIVFLHLFLDALLLQPCNPTFLTARTAWIQADANRYAGANKCVLWKAFASRGLGPNAANYTDDTSVPSDCA